MRDRHTKIELLPPRPDAWPVSKRQAVASELSSAIYLFFCDKDFVAAHVLGGAARDVLRDVARKKGIETFWDKSKDVVVDEYQEAFRGLMSADYNFFKHGSRDPDGTYERYHPDLTAFLLWECVYDFSSVYGGRYLETMVFAAWMSLRRPNLIQEAYRKEVLALYANMRVTPEMSFVDSLVAPADMLSAARQHAAIIERSIPLLRRERVQGRLPI